MKPRDHLARHEHINVRAIRKVPRTPTGTALIAVDRRGQNNIIVVAGANARLTAADVRARARHVRRARALLVPLEVPMPAVLEAMRIANAANVPIVFNPSPLRADFPWGVMTLHTVIVNELEARQIFWPFPPQLRSRSLCLAERNYQATHWPTARDPRRAAHAWPDGGKVFQGAHVARAAR